MAFNNSGNNNNELDQLLMLMQKHKHQHGRLVIRASRGQSNDALDDFAKNVLEDVKLRGVPLAASSQPSPLAVSSQPSPLPASSQPSPPRQQEQTSRRNRQKHQCKQEPEDVIVLDMEPDEERHCSEEENRLDDKQASSTAVASPKDDTINGSDNNNDKPLAKRRRTADIKFDDFLADNNNLRHSKGVTTAVINDHLRDLGLKAPLSKFGISRDGENDVVILQFKNERTSLPFLDEKTGQLTIL
ncbi:expressed unknown protein [Seminavis robusta]|uniref:Uncharacterized protein n=1 Tax=Seminavis robusta TaxID=568900 RepID=A0A9N8EP21_9STRA|nr:expressed unknown protein [Seminavis robusta]|eukprot:Sro1349_g265120.1 n/a (244) ;mRNA; f:27273-28004